MRNFGALVTNEWLKQYKKKSFFVPYAAMALFIGMCVYMDAGAGEQATSSMLGFMGMFVSMQSAGQLLTFIIVACVAGIVPLEYRLGTIKLLLIRANARGKILASKYVVMLLIAFSLIAAVFAMGIAAGLLLYGFDAGGGGWSDVAWNALYMCVYAVVYVTLTFLIGILTRSSGATIGISLFLLTLSGLATILLSKYSFTKYLLFPNVDLSIYGGGGEPPLSGMSPAFSSAVLAVYMIIFLIAGFTVFQKRDVA